MRHKVSTADRVYRYLIGGKHGIFSQGWGDPERVKELLEFHQTMSNRDKVQALLDENSEVIIDNVQNHGMENCIIHNGHFLSPFAKLCPRLLPEASKYCYFQLITPLREFKETKDKAVAIHMAGTGDQYYWRRRYFLADQLANVNGISSIILENPFYGCRRPPDQIRSNVKFVSDIFSMGAGLMLEGLTIIRWLEQQQGFGPFCMTGVSMGGHMASLCATNYPKPIAIAPCLSWTTASSVFTRGVMSNSINWEKCELDYTRDKTYSAEVFDKLIHYELKEDEADKTETESYSSTNSDGDPRSKVLWVFAPTITLLRKLLEAMSSIPKYFPGDIKRNFPSFPFASFFNLGNNTDKHTPFLSYSPSTSQLSTKSKKIKSNFQLSFPNFKGKFFKKITNTTSDSSQSTSKRSSLNNFYRHSLETEERKNSIEFMRRLMDHFTHLSNFEKPVDPELATIIVARFDGYVLRDGVTAIEDIWPGCTVHYVNSGHVLAFLKYQHMFRQAICESIDKHRAKYYSDGTPRNPPHPSVGAGLNCHPPGSTCKFSSVSSSVLTSSSEFQLQCENENEAKVPELHNATQSSLFFPRNYNRNLIGQNQNRSLSLFVNQANSISRY